MIVFDGQIELLSSQHERRNFSCGEAALDEYLRRFAKQHAASRISRTYVAVKGGRILGYYSLSMSAIVRDQLPEQYQKRFPNCPVPMARLARLAVAQQQQGRGLGSLLLSDALYRCYQLSNEIGSVGVVVNAKDDRARKFYQHFDFEAFPESPLTLWLPIHAVAKLFDTR